MEEKNEKQDKHKSLTYTCSTSEEGIVRGKVIHTIHTYMHLHLHLHFTKYRTRRRRRRRANYFTIFECNWFICMEASRVSRCRCENFVKTTFSYLNILVNSTIAIASNEIRFYVFFLPLFIVATTIKVKLNQ